MFSDSSTNVEEISTNFLKVGILGKHRVRWMEKSFKKSPSLHFANFAHNLTCSLDFLFQIQQQIELAAIMFLALKPFHQITYFFREFCCIVLWKMSTIYPLCHVELIAGSEKISENGPKHMIRKKRNKTIIRMCHEQQHSYKDI